MFRRVPAAPERSGVQITKGEETRKGREKVRGRQKGKSREIEQAILKGEDCVRREKERMSERNDDRGSGNSSK